MAQKKYASYASLQNLVGKIKELFVSKTDLNTELAKKADSSHTHSISNVTNLQSTLDGKVPTSRTVNGKALSANITLSASDVGAASSSHDHSDKYYGKTEIDTKLSGKSDTTHNHNSAYDAKGAAAAVQENLDTVSDKLDAHTENDDIHVTTTNKTNWNAAYTHSTSAHARADATKVADSTTNGNILINGTETNVYSHPNSGVSAGTYKSVTVNAQGHITGGSNPTTLAGFGITDGETKGASSSAVSSHNTSTTSHNDIRILINELTTKLNNFLDVDDTTTDQLSELLTLIEDNATDIESITNGKVNVSDIINNLTTNVANKPLSAAQGVAIKSLIDNLQTAVNSKVDSLSDLGITATATELNYMDGVTSNVQTQLDSKANSATLIGRAGEGSGAEIFNDYSSNTASGRQAHAEGYDTTASGMRAHAEGQSTTASAQATHAEGYNTQATDTAAHSEGYYTEATGKYSHAEGYMSKAQEQYAHAEGYSNTASGEASHAEGYATWADGNYSHTEGSTTTASGDYSHAEGFYVKAAGRYQHVQGKYNIIDEDASGAALDTYAHIVGNGTSNTKRSNAHTIDWNGNGWFAGDVLVGGTSQDDASKVITEADQKWNLLYDSGEISDIVNSISNIDVSGYTNIQVLVRIYNDGDSVGSRNGSAIFKCTNGKNYQFPVWANMFSKSINTVYVMATFNLVDGWLICPCASRLIGDATTFEDTEGGTAGSLAPTGSGMMKCTSPLSTLTISSLDQNSNYYFGMGSRVIVWGWNA